jgi:hypothetical protein
MAEATDAEILHLQQLIAIYTRRLRLRETQIAMHGLASAPADIVLDKQEAERELQIAHAELFRLHPQARSRRNPYKGLLTFDEDDADIFFGRETLVANLLREVAHRSFLAVIGPSGSGKSSVVRAGLLPMLKAGVVPGSDRWHYLPVITPGPRPLNSLANALSTLGTGTLGDIATIRRALHQETDALLLISDRLREGRASERLVLVIDQAEELWTRTPSDPAAAEAWRDEQQQPLLRTLLTVIQNSYTDSIPPVLVVLTMRADFLHRAIEDSALGPLIADHHCFVLPMPPEDLHRAIVCPAELAGGQFEPGLVDALVAETRQPGTLPLLAYTLHQLWKTCDDGILAWSAYHALGGVEGALAREADDLLARHYLPIEQADLRAILLRLVQPGSPGSDTRRRMRLDDLAPAGVTRATVQNRLQPLINARLLTTAQDDQGQATVEVAHEALIQAWPALSAWIDAARADLRIQRQVEDAAREWQESRQHVDLLWQGLRLAQAEAWVAQARPVLLEREHQFLSASRAAEETRSQAERSRTRRIIVGLVMALVLITSFAGATLWFWRTSERAGSISQARFLVAEGQRRYAARPLLALRLMVEGLATLPLDEPTVQTDLQQTIMTYMEQGRVHVFVDDASGVVAAPGGTTLVIARRNRPGLIVWEPAAQPVELPAPLATDYYGDPIVGFSPDGGFVAVNYAGNQGSAVWRRDGTSFPLPAPLTTAGDRPAVSFSEDDRLAFFAYTTGHYEVRQIAHPEIPIKLGANIKRIFFVSNSTLVVTAYNDGSIYLMDAQLPAPSTPGGTPISPQQLITFVCTTPLKSGLWTDQDSIDFVATLRTTAPRACQS